jgi:hypothetical protein
MKFRFLLAAVLVGAAVPLLSAKVEPFAPDARAEKSPAYTVTVDGQDVFTTRFRDVHYAAFALDRPAAVEVRADAPVRDFNVSPHAAGIAARAEGATLKFTLDRPRHLVVTINGGERLFLFANPVETDAPRPGDAGVTSVADFGVDATGGRVETVRLQQAIDRVAAEKGVLYFPPGVYLTGTLSLKSNLTLYLAAGARLLASDNPDDFPPDAGWDEANLRYDPDLWFRLGRVDAAYRRVLFVDGATHVRVAGRGIIDGQGKALRFRKNIEFVLVRKSSDVSFEGVTLLDAPMYNAHVLASERVTFRNIKIVSDQNVPNTDGIDPDSSKDVLIDGCFLLCADDCVSPKTSGQTLLTGDLERLTVRNSVMLSRTSATKFGNESFGGMMRDITFENNDLLEGDRAITISCLDGNGYENVKFIDTRVESLLPGKRQFPFQIHTRQRKPGGPSGHIHNVVFKNLTVEKEYKNPSKISGVDAQNDVRGVHFINFVMAGKVRLNAADAHVEIGPFVSDVTFSGPEE